MYKLTKVSNNAWAYMNLVKLALNSGMSDSEIIELLRIANGHLPRVKLEYDQLEAELDSLEDEKSNSAKEHQRLCNETSEMETTVNQLKLVTKRLKEEKLSLNCKR